MPVQAGQVDEVSEQSLRKRMLIVLIKIMLVVVLTLSCCVVVAVCVLEIGERKGIYLNYYFKVIYNDYNY